MIQDRGALRRAPLTTQSAPAAPAPPSPAPKADRATPWRERELLPLRVAAEIIGISPASLYRLQAEGRVTFKRIAGRVLLPVADIAAIVDGAENWKASAQGLAARQARVEAARAAWGERAA